MDLDVRSAHDGSSYKVVKSGDLTIPMFIIGLDLHDQPLNLLNPFDASTFTLSIPTPRLNRLDRIHGAVRSRTAG